MPWRKDVSKLIGLSVVYDYCETRNKLKLLNRTTECWATNKHQIWLTAILSRRIQLRGVLNESHGTLILTSETGGTPAYSYAWKNFPNETGNSISITDPGNYSVTIAENQGCFSTQTSLATAIEIDFKTGF